MNHHLPNYVDVQSTAQDRARFLTNIYDLKFDPFRDNRAEKELNESPEDPPFFRYYVDPDDGTLFANLMASPWFAVFGDEGSGKTTLRYRVEERIRHRTECVLVVGYNFGPGTDDFLPRMVETMAVDLYVQLLERYSELGVNLTDEQIAKIAQFWITYLPSFARDLQRDIGSHSTQNLHGIASHWWTIWHRPVIRKIPLTAARRQFMNSVSEYAVRSPVSSDATDWENGFQQCLQLAHEIGFTGCSFLVDANNVQEINKSHFFELLQYLKDHETGINCSIPLSARFFLPLAIKNELVSHAEQDILADKLPYAIIKWQDDALQHVIANRFRSAGSRFKEFNNIAETAFSSKLDQAMVNEARQSPRRLLRIAQALLNAHVSRDANDPIISISDWDLMRQLWPYVNEPLSSWDVHVGASMSLYHEIRHNFADNLHVQRTIDEDVAQTWLANTSSQLLSVAGPPGVGKSWFLSWIDTHCLDNGAYHTVWFQVGDLIALDKNVTAYLDEQKIAPWLARLDTKLQNWGCTWQLDTDEEDIAEQLNSLGQAIVACCGEEKQPLILVDGADDFPDPLWREYEVNIIEPLARQASIRFVIALRDSVRINTMPLRWTEKRHPLSALEDYRDQQIAKLIANEQDGTVALSADNITSIHSAIRQLAATYDFSYPALNTFLFHIGKHSASGSQPNYIRQSGREIMTLALMALNNQLDQKSAREVAEQLSQIETVCGDSWSVTDLVQKLHLSPNEAFSLILALEGTFFIQSYGGNQ
ncbi:MAG: hypothetical protein KDE09_12605, partial [Anaerolineales bacterium]|nr:hypothetical protein [Anaerolineales bacterium]